jgi:hypothetical protein
MNDAGHFAPASAYYSLAALQAAGSHVKQPVGGYARWVEPNWLRGWLAARDWSQPDTAGRHILYLGSVLAWEAVHTGQPAYAAAGEALLAWLDQFQNPDTGFWDIDRRLAGTQPAMDGAAAIGALYFFQARPLAHMRRILDLTLSMQKADGLFGSHATGCAATDLAATSLLTQCGRLDPDYRADEVKMSLMAAFEAILEQRTPDGAFCDARRKKQAHSDEAQRLRHPDCVALTYSPTESDLWSTYTRVLALALISQRYPGELIEGLTWHFINWPAPGWIPSEKLASLRRPMERTD